ncbi:MAG TPA: insulinase family protein, partial [Pyrinomonadaceae bacterium]|nr:insulinase family protein [Pyrinomonadaceae bacterium]
DGWIDKYFSKVTHPASAIPRVNVTEPPRTKEERYTKTRPNVPFPAVALTWLAPRSDDPDMAALEVADKILSGGESSRLYQSLVYKKQIATEAGFVNNKMTEGGFMALYAIAAGENKPETVEKGLLDEVALIQSKGVTARELAKAKNQLIADAVRERENNAGKADAVESAMIFEHNAQAVNSDIQKLQAVTAADVLRVMKKYFTANGRLVLYYLNDGGAK